MEAIDRRLADAQRESEAADKAAAAARSRREKLQVEKEELTKHLAMVILDAEALKSKRLEELMRELGVVDKSEASFKGFTEDGKT